MNIYIQQSLILTKTQLLRLCTMAKTTKIIRTSIFTFLQNYQHFTSTPTLFVLPFAISTLLSQSLVSSYSSRLFPLLHGHLRSIFLAIGLPHLSSILSKILNPKLCQEIYAYLFTSPFTFSFLLLSKASIIIFLKQHRTLKNTSIQSIQLFNPLLRTQLCNLLIILLANATCFCLLSTILSLFGFSTWLRLLWSVMYSLVLANAYAVSNLALILSGIENYGGFATILKACCLIRNQTTTALSLTVSVKLCLIAIESLFQYRVAKGYDHSMGPSLSMVLEGMLISYLYSLVLVLDTIIGYIFLKSCKPEKDYFQRIETHEGGDKNFSKLVC